MINLKMCGFVLVSALVALVGAKEQKIKLILGVHVDYPKNSLFVTALIIKINILNLLNI